MLIGAYQPLTLLDFPDKLASIVFTVGCNFRCHYCQNPEFISASNFPKKNLIPEKIIFDHLKKRIGLLDGVVITGGEPTIQKDLMPFIKKIKKLGFLVKLDTNGSRPDVIEKLLKEKLIDYIAMDIKASPKKYEEVIGVKVDIEKVQSAKRKVQSSGIEYEFRTTVLPRFHSEKEIRKIGGWIKEAEKHYIQNFWNKKVLTPKFKKEKSFTEKELDGLKKIMMEYVRNCEIRQ